MLNHSGRPSVITGALEIGEPFSGCGQRDLRKAERWKTHIADFEVATRGRH